MCFFVHPSSMFGCILKKLFQGDTVGWSFCVFWFEVEVGFQISIADAIAFWRQPLLFFSEIHFFPDLSPHFVVLVSFSFSSCFVFLSLFFLHA